MFEMFGELMFVITYSVIPAISALIIYFALKRECKGKLIDENEEKMENYK